jgi:hypothetical protein
VKLHLEEIIVMKLPKVIVAALVGMSFVPGAWAAKNNATPLATAATTPTEYYGTIEVTLEIIAKSTFAAGTPIYCTASLDVGNYEGTAGKITAAQETAAAPAKLSGGKANCVVSIPYFWYLVPAADTTVSMSVGANAGSTATVGTTVGRSSTRTIGAFPIPTPGATTTFAYTVYL